MGAHQLRESQSLNNNGRQYNKANWSSRNPKTQIESHQGTSFFQLIHQGLEYQFLGIETE